jgi:hypothetical protein
MKQLLLILVVTVATAGGAHAQSADSSSTARVPLARKLYDEGVDAVGKGHWSIAHDRFKTSYELAPRVLTLFNLAGAQSQTGRLIEATENYRKFLRETSDGRYPEHRTEATSQLDLLEKQIAQVTLEISRVEPDEVVAIDEIAFPHLALHEAIPMNPGQHVVRVQRGTTVLATRTFMLAAGAVESVPIEITTKPPDLQVHEVAAPPLASVASPGPGPLDHGSSHPWLRSPWLWSGVAVLVAGMATGAYLFTRPDGVTIH